MNNPRPPGFQPMALFLLLLLAACGRDRNKVVAPDSVAPAAVSDLTAAALTDTSIQLVWTAPGDDGDEGRASRYDIRINPEPFPNGHFPPLPTVGDSLAPAAAGTTQTVTANGLKPNTTYYFAMIAADEVPNWSRISNVASQKTLSAPPPPDITPPQAITDLNVVSFTPTSVTLTWTSVGDDGTDGLASAYDVRYAPEPISEVIWNLASQVTGEPNPAPAGREETLKVPGLTPGDVLYFAIKAADEVPNWSTVSPSIQAMTNVPRIWQIYPDGSGDAPTIQAAIDQALGLDTVLVHPGTYYANLVLSERDIVLKSTGGRVTTILDGSRGTGPVIMINTGISQLSQIEGFKITGGHNDLGGGGIMCRWGSPTISDNWFFRNSTAHAGGGLLVGSVAGIPGGRSAPLIQGNLFEENVADAPIRGNGGGAAAVEPGEPVFVDNVFIQNRCRFDGGGLWVSLLYGSIAIEKNQFIGNEAGDHGGGLYAGNPGVVSIFTVRKNLIARNVARGNDGLRNTGSGGGIWVSNIHGCVENNTIVANIGLGGSEANGGGILLEGGATEAVCIRANIVALNTGGAFVTFEASTTTEFGRNLFWANDRDFFAVRGTIPLAWPAQVQHVDPCFCDPGHDDYTLASDSPALQGKEVLGAFQEPGCPPGCQP